MWYVSENLFSLKVGVKQKTERKVSLRFVTFLVYYFFFFKFLLFMGML